MNIGDESGGAQTSPSKKDKRCIKKGWQVLKNDGGGDVPLFFETVPASSDKGELPTANKKLDLLKLAYSYAREVRIWILLLTLVAVYCTSSVGVLIAIGEFMWAPAGLACAVCTCYLSRRLLYLYSKELEAKRQLQEAVEKG